MAVALAIALCISWQQPFISQYLVLKAAYGWRWLIKCGVPWPRRPAAAGALWRRLKWRRKPMASQPIEAAANGG